MSTLKIKRVAGVEWSVAFGALILIASFFFPFSGGEKAVESMPIFSAFVLAVALLGLLLPVVVASSPTTNVPIVYEIFLSTISSIAVVVVVARMFWHPGDALDFGASMAGFGALLSLHRGLEERLARRLSHPEPRCRAADRGPVRLI